MVGGCWEGCANSCVVVLHDAVTCCHGIRLTRLVLREARGFSTGLCREAVLHRCSLVSSNMVCERSTRCVRLPGAHARALHNLIVQGSCCIAQPHGQRRTAVTAKRMISLRCNGVSRMLVALARGGDGEGSGGVGGARSIFSPEQALKPVPLLRKANSR